MYPSDNEAEDRKRQQNAAKYIDQSVKSTGRSVYILIFESWDHSGNYGRGADNDTLGAFDSKEAAVAVATNYQTNYGTFDEAVKDMFGDDYDYVDNRHNPPDNGVLMQLGSEDSGEGDYERFIIKKVDIQGLGPKKKRSTNQSSKKKAIKKPRVDDEDDSDDNNFYGVAF